MLLRDRVLAVSGALLAFDSCCLKTQALGHTGGPLLGRRPSGGLGPGPAPLNLFAGGGNGSVFAPPARQAAQAPNRGFG